MASLNLTEDDSHVRWGAWEVSLWEKLGMDQRSTRKWPEQHRLYTLISTDSCLSAHLPVCLPICLLACLPACPSAWLPACPPACLPDWLPTWPLACPPVCLSAYLSNYLCEAPCLITRSTICLRFLSVATHFLRVSSPFLKYYTNWNLSDAKISLATPLTNFWSIPDSIHPFKTYTKRIAYSHTY